MFFCKAEIISQTIKGNQNVVNEERPAPHVKNLSVNGNFNIYIVEGTSERLILETDENIQSAIQTQVKDSTLFITTTQKIKNPTVLNVFLTLTQISKISLSGTSNFYFYSNITENLEILTENENSELKLLISNANLNCKIYGLGFVEIKGIFQNLSLDVDNESTLTLDIISKTLTCSLNDMSMGIFYGNTEKLIIQLNEDSYLNSFNLLTRDCDIDINGLAEAKINVSDKLTIKGIRGGFLQYKGEPNINLANSVEESLMRNKK